MENNTNYNIRHWENNFGKPHSHWKYIALGDLFVEQISTSVNDGTYTLCSLTIEEGVVEKSDRYNREFLLKDQESNKYKCVQLGDIVINPMNLRFGAVAKSEHKNTVLVSGYYNVIKPSDLADSNYLISLLQSSAMGYMYERIALGSLNEKKRVHLSALKNVLIPVPSVKEQRKIGEILSTWDNAIRTTERLIDNSKQQKKALMQQLLTGKKRLLDDSGKPFEGEWSKVELGKLLDYKQPTPYLVKSTDYSDEYSTPVLTAGKTFILGYSNEDFGIFEEELPAIIFDDFTTASKFVDFPFKAKSSAMKILVAKQGVSIKFVYESMQVMNYPVGGHQRHWISIFANLVIGLPSLLEQQKIASVLSNADKEIELLEQQLADLKQEKKALMQQLLTGKRRVKLDDKEVA